MEHRDDRFHPEGAAKSLICHTWVRAQRLVAQKMDLDESRRVLMKAERLRQKVTFRSRADT